jgi:hypothetical protein
MTSNPCHDATVERLRADCSAAVTKDTLVIVKAQKRLLRLRRRFGSWTKVEEVIHVNHGHMSALVNRGTVPRSPETRAALGLSRVMPSERRPRKARARPEGSPCRGCKAVSISSGGAGLYPAVRLPPLRRSPRARLRRSADWQRARPG